MRWGAARLPALRFDVQQASSGKVGDGRPPRLSLPVATIVWRAAMGVLTLERALLIQMPHTGDDSEDLLSIFPQALSATQYASNARTFPSSQDD